MRIGITRFRSQVSHVRVLGKGLLVGHEQDRDARRLGEPLEKLTRLVDVLIGYSSQGFIQQQKWPALQAHQGQDAQDERSNTSGATSKRMKRMTSDLDAIACLLDEKVDRDPAVTLRNFGLEA